MALYRYGVIIGSVIAVVMFMVGGLLYMTAGGIPSNVSKAQEVMVGSISGLALLLCAYLMLNIINPNLVHFKPIQVETLKLAEFPDEMDAKDPNMGGVPLPPDNLEKDVKPTMAATPNSLPLSSEVSGNCNIVIKESFTFDVAQFSDGANGQCLLTLLGAGQSNIVSVTFLGQRLQAHKVVADALRTVEAKIRQSSSPVVQNWVRTFKTGGGYVNSSPPSRWQKSCAAAKNKTVVVVDSKKNADRLLTSVARVMNGNKREIKWDMHSIGMAIDVDTLQNWEYFEKRPVVTNIPPEVAMAFMENNFTWLGSAAGRDAMHFEFKAPNCFNKPVPKLFTGNGCCMITTAIQDNIPQYAKCLSLGGRDTTYEGCLGPGGLPGAVWIKKDPVK